MAANVGYATLSIIPSAKGFRSALGKELGPDLEKAGGDVGDRTATRFSTRFSSGLKTAGKVGALAFGAALGGGIVIGRQAIDAASNLDESMTKVDAVFGDAAGAVIEWSKTSSTAFGQSQQQALEAAGTYGNLFQAFGVGRQPAQQMSQDLVELAADLASFNNTSVDDALLALRSGLSGETEPLKRFGVAINDARLKQVAFEMGLISSTKDALDPAAKSLAAYHLIMEDTELAQGDFARTSDGLANRQRILSARWENAKASIGQALLPAMSSVVGFIADKFIPGVQRLADQWMPRLRRAFEAVSEWVRANWPAIRDVITDVVEQIQVAFAWFSENVAPHLVAAFQGIVAFVRENWPEIRQTIADVMETIQVVIEGAIEILTKIWERWGKDISRFVEKYFGGAVKIIQGALDVIQGIIKTVTAIIRGDWDAAWNGIKQIVEGAWSVIRGVVEQALATIELLIRVAFDVLKGIVSAGWGAIKSLVSTGWEGIKTVVSNAVTAVVGFVTGIPGRLQHLAATAFAVLNTAITGAKNWISDRVNDIVALVAGIPGRVLGVGQAMYDAGKAIFGRLVDGIKAVWNSTIGGRGISFGGGGFGPVKIPKVSITIPRLHTGGEVPGIPGTEVPILALAGERVLSPAQNREYEEQRPQQSGPLVENLTVGSARDVPLVLDELDRIRFLYGASA